MKTIIYAVLITTLTAWSNPGSAQFMTKKEASSIDELLMELSEKHKSGSYLFKNVNLLTMIDSVIIVGQDVFVENGMIQEIGSGITKQKATVIDGTGKYLMPGLTDMHIHLFEHHQMKNTWMLLLLLNGVTSVRDMAGESGKLALREKINWNEVLGPNIYQAGPIINGKGNNPTLIVSSTPEEGRNQVRKQKALGYDFIKVYNDLESEVYWAIIDEAQKQDILVVGHVPDAITLKEAVGKQSSIEHLTGYRAWKDNVGTYLNTDPDYTLATAESDTWNCPTLFNLLINWEKGMAQSVLDNRSISNQLPDKLKKRWIKILGENLEEKEELLAKYGDHNKALFKEIVLSLYQANAKLITGTDAGSIPFLVPGFSLHEELIALHDVGIPIYDVLRMATINAALAMEKEQVFGTIEVGKRADLLLLDNNPLADPPFLKKKRGVMVRGIWLSIADLEEISDGIQMAFEK